MKHKEKLNGFQVNFLKVYKLLMIKKVFWITSKTGLKSF